MGDTTAREQPATPEHDKLKARKDEIDAIFDFCKHIKAKGIVFCTRSTRREDDSDLAVYIPVDGGRLGEKIIDDYLDVDRAAIKAEKQAVLDWMIAGHGEI